MANYEKDKALWEEKSRFLEEQKEKAKQDLADSLRKFETTLVHLQKARNSEKDEHEANMNELMSALERKFQN